MSDHGDDHGEGGGGLPSPVLLIGVVLFLCYVFPQVAGVVFGTVPAAATVTTNAITKESAHIGSVHYTDAPEVVLNQVMPLADTGGSMVRNTARAALRTTGEAAIAPPKAAAYAVASAAVVPVKALASAFERSDSSVAEASGYSIKVSPRLAYAAQTAIAQVSDEYQVPVPSVYGDAATVTEEPAAPTMLDSFLAPMLSFWGLFVPIALVLSAVFAGFIVYLYIKTAEIRHLEHEEMHAAHHPVIHEDKSAVQKRFQEVQRLAESTNPNDWRVAIIEADIMLDDLLQSQGYPGDTLGDRLKAVDKADFHTIDAAWEAHKIRNRIAHDGSNHLLNEREVRRVVSLFEAVFREFKYI